MIRQASADPTADTLAFVDESGARGYSRNLTLERDHELGLVCALLVPVPHVEEFRDAFRSGYESFVDAMPHEAKLHITDAFAPGHEPWARIARAVRSEFHGAVHRLGIPVVYEARRLRVDRESHKLRERLFSRPGERPSQSRIEDSLVTGLSLKLDAFCEDFQRRQVDLMFDTIDGTVARLYRDTMEITRKIGRSSRIVKRRHPDPDARATFRLDFNAHAPFPLHTRHLGELLVVGKSDPLILATDIVANGLYDHLASLPQDAHLNRPSSIDGWELEDSVYGTMENAIGDII